MSVVSFQSDDSLKIQVQERTSYKDDFDIFANRANKNFSKYFSLKVNHRQLTLFYSNSIYWKNRSF